MRTQLHSNPLSHRLRNGKLVAVLKSTKTHEHITLRVICKNKRLTEERKNASRRQNESGRASSDSSFITFADAAIVTFDVPQYQDEQGNYGPKGDRVAYIHPNGSLVPNKGADPTRVWAVERLWEYLTTGHEHPQIEYRYENVCSRCGRAISHPQSLDDLMGPECSGKRKYATKHQTRRPRSEDAQQELLAG